MSPTETEIREWTNPLLSFRPKTIGSWDGWMVAWEAAELAEVRHQLLHIGLDLLHKDERQAIPFYLQVADGHQNHISTPEDSYHDLGWLGSRNPKKEGEIRQILAAKAFSVLVNNFFGAPIRGRSEDIPGWVQTIFLGQNLEAVVWFLRFESTRDPLREPWSPRNFKVAYLHSKTEERATEVMREFITYLAKLALMPSFQEDVIDRSGWIREHRESIYQRLVEVRPQLVELLAFIGQLDLLLWRGVEIDEVWLASLRQVAGVDESTSVADLVMQHKRAAMVLQNLNTIRHGQIVAEARAEADAAKAKADELESSTP